MFNMWNILTFAVVCQSAKDCTRYTQEEQCMQSDVEFPESQPGDYHCVWNPKISQCNLVKSCYGDNVELCDNINARYPDYGCLFLADSCVPPDNCAKANNVSSEATPEDCATMNDALNEDSCCALDNGNTCIASLCEDQGGGEVISSLEQLPLFAAVGAAILTLF